MGTSGRSSSATELLLSQEESRIPALVPVRHARMSQSALAFYRGGAIVMASDLGRTVNSGLEVMLCGDAHLSNFGIFGSAEHNVVFDVNDFDETARRVPSSGMSCGWWRRSC